MTIAEALRRHEEAMNGLDNAISDILNTVEDDIVEMQQERLMKGLFVSEAEIYPFYTPFTVQVKKEKGQPHDKVTLKDTGAFHDAIFAAQFGDKIVIDSDDEKSGELKEKYSENIFGLTQENKEILQQKTAKQIAKYYKSVTGFK